MVGNTQRDSRTDRLGLSCLANVGSKIPSMLAWIVETELANA